MKADRAAGAMCIALGAGMALNAVLGPLILGVIRFRESAGMENQLVGGELTSLCIAAPLAVAAGVLWWRGEEIAPFVALGPAGFALYTYIQFVLVPDYSRYPGNNEAWFPLYLVLVILGWTLAWRAWQELRAHVIPPLERRLASTLGWVLVVMNGVFALAWWASIAAIIGGQRPSEYVEHPTAFWLVRLMDLGFVIPIGVITGLDLIRGDQRGSRRAYAFTGTQMLLACAVAGMAMRMWVREDPTATPVLLLVSTIGAASFAVLYGILMSRRLT